MQWLLASVSASKDVPHSQCLTRNILRALAGAYVRNPNPAGGLQLQLVVALPVAISSRNGSNSLGKATLESIETEMVPTYLAKVHWGMYFERGRYRHF